MIPAYAWADVLPDTPDETVLGTKVGRAVDPNSAVFVAVGKSIDSLTSEQQAAFINATTGTEGLESYAYFRGTMYTPTSTVGPVSATYYSTLTGTEYAMACAAARSDIVNYLKGSGSGGSGGNNEPSQTVGNTLVMQPLEGYFAYSNNGSKAVSVNSFTSTISLDESSVTAINNELSTYPYMLVVMVNRLSSNTSASAKVIYFYASTVPITYSTTETSTTTIGGVTVPVFTLNVTLSMPHRYATLTKGTITTGLPSAYDLSATIGNRSNVSSSTQSIVSLIGARYYTNVSNNGGGGSGGGDEPVTPPVEQPTNPTGPTITGPNINVNTGGNNSSTTTADLTPILEMLRIINDNIGIVNGNITSFSDWFGDAWGDYVDWLQLWFERFGLSLDNIYAQQELVGNNIVDELREIEDVLWYIFYKPDPEFPTSTPYDDTELQGILNGMWADNNGYLNAIQNLLMQISGQIDGLDDVYTPHVGTGKTTQEQLDEDVARLKRKFPFSIPWDLYALLQFLQAPPAAPTFSFTLPYMGTLQCDLSVFDDVAAVCRWVSLLWFVAGLLASTNKLLNLMNVYERND